MKTGSIYVENPFALVVSGTGLGMSIVIGSNAVVYYAENRDSQ